MGIKTFKPTSPARRYYSVSDFDELTQGRAREDARSSTSTATGGRNNHGRITSRFRGGGHKQRYRIIDFKRDKIGVPAKVASIEYDPNRTARIALLHYADGEKRYILAPDGLDGRRQDRRRAATPTSSRATACRCASSRSARRSTTSSCKKGKGGAARAARPASPRSSWRRKATGRRSACRRGEVRKVHLDCRATIGQVGNIEHANISLGKAGRTRWLGRRPHNRGVTMNPVDHPMGGGEGRTSGGRHPCSPWGQLAKGLKTRNNKRTDGMIIKRRGQKG